MDKNTKNLLTAGAVIVGGIILLKGAKEFIDDITGVGSFGGADTGPVDTKVWSGNNKTEYEQTPKITTYSDTSDFLTNLSQSQQFTADFIEREKYYQQVLNTSSQNILSDYAEGKITRDEYLAIFNSPEYKAQNMEKSLAEAYYKRTADYLTQFKDPNTALATKEGRDLLNYLLPSEQSLKARSYAFTSDVAQEPFKNYPLEVINIKQTSSTPLQTPDTSKLSETNLGYDVVSGLINPITYLPLGLASQVGMEYNDYLVTKNEGKNILERNYTAKELEKMSPFEKSIKQEYQKVAEPLKTTGGLIKSTAVKIGSSSLSTASKVVSYAKNTTNNVVNAVKTSVGSTKSSSSKSSSSSSKSSSSSSKSSSSSSKSNVSSNLIVSGKAGTLTTSQVKNASSNAKFIGMSSTSGNVVSNAISNLAKKSGVKQSASIFSFGKSSSSKSTKK